MTWPTTSYDASSQVLIHLLELVHQTAKPLALDRVNRGEVKDHLLAGLPGPADPPHPLLDRHGASRQVEVDYQGLLLGTAGTGRSAFNLERVRARVGHPPAAGNALPSAQMKF